MEVMPARQARQSDSGRQEKPAGQLADWPGEKPRGNRSEPAEQPAGHSEQPVQYYLYCTSTGEEVAAHLPRVRQSGARQDQRAEPGFRGPALLAPADRPGLGQPRLPTRPALHLCLAHACACKECCALIPPKHLICIMRAAQA